MQQRLFLKQNLISFFLLTFSLLLILFLIPSVKFIPHGLAYSTGKYKPTSDYLVDIYINRPIAGKEIGRIRAERAIIDFDDKAKKETLAYVKKLAADKGATGVQVDVFASQGRVIIFMGTLFR